MCRRPAGRLRRTLGVRRIHRRQSIYPVARRPKSVEIPIFLKRYTQFGTTGETGIDREGFRAVADITQSGIGS